MPPPRRSAPRIYELTLRLSDVQPSVWRRLRISSGATLSRAARVFAIALGWNPGRRFAFAVGSLRYEGEGPGKVTGDESGVTNGRNGEQDVRLRQVLPDTGSELEFEYGARLPWHFTVVLDRVLPPDGDARVPFCIGGAGAAPPLHVEGPWAYEEWRSEPVSDHTAEVAAADRYGDEPGDALVPFNADVVNARLEMITRSSRRV